MLLAGSMLVGALMCLAQIGLCLCSPAGHKPYLQGAGSQEQILFSGDASGSLHAWQVQVQRSEQPWQSLWSTKVRLTLGFIGMAAEI